MFNSVNYLGVVYTLKAGTAAMLKRCACSQGSSSA
jgi:hypothetical protein